MADYKMVSETSGAHTTAMKNEYLVANEAALADIPSDAPEGSIAYTAGGKFWMKDLDGEWEEM